MKANLNFATRIDEIEFKAFLGTDIERYQKYFEQWYYTPENDYLQMRAETIIKWMLLVAPKCNARITKSWIIPGEEDTSLPYMCF